jgi:hypothetical protein
MCGAMYRMLILERAMRHYSRREQEKRRERRLRTKAQKAGCVDRVDEILDKCYSWNKRFGCVQRSRSRYKCGQVTL